MASNKKMADEVQPTKDIEDTASKARQSGQAGWYVIHTYAGYEEQVAENLLQRVTTLKLQDYIFDVIVPKEKQVEIKNGKRKVVEKRSFPGYVFVNMIVTDEAWYVVRNTPSVTGFLGSGVRPTPIPQSEIDAIKTKMAKDEPEHTIDLKLDDLVRISDGPLKGYEGKITEVDEAKGKVKISVSMFGRETPVNLDFLQVKKI
ncbi:MAG TPA: transcription termination/antitermination protein NusG [Candidatus Saccharimonadales bacterium]|nr:transcription termination/antitermination protein NusG [Candidatus Saccharimonadales bacterium]